MTGPVVSESAFGGEFDLQPDPRILPMLGEINLEQWRCLAELIDNAVDGFLNSARSGTSLSNPEVYIDLPTADKIDAIVRVRDNGPGMAPSILQRAVRAGWSGSSSTDNLGLFGMGFNIATARLGAATEVWTTQVGDLEWHGLEIDFEALRKQRHFRTPHLRRPKADSAQHGTEIVIRRLKPEQRAWMARGPNQSLVRRLLSQTYTAMLRPNGIPVSFSLFVGSKRVVPRNHCVWDEARTVELPELGAIPAVIQVDHQLAKRPYCTNCLAWPPPGSEGDDQCPLCAAAGSIVTRSRRVRGWIGLQRYLHKTDFGFDLLRNGRKIEIGNKDLFVWKGQNGEEPEYPIDDQRGRGRFVGEIHIDHCRVSYAKDRFDRTDPSWEEMVRLLRGEGPLRPEKAKEMGFIGNTSPLFRLFRAFRRSSPQTKVAGGWRRILVVKDNDRATEMAEAFFGGDAEHQSDAKWWSLVEEAERGLLVGTVTAPATPPTAEGAAQPVQPVLPAGLLGGLTKAPTAVAPATVPETSAPPPLRRPLSSLSRKYLHQPSATPWTVAAFSVERTDPDLPNGAPWLMKMGDVSSRTHHFLVQESHECFRSMTLTPADALLIELAAMTVDYSKNSAMPLAFPKTLIEFREAYGERQLLDPRQMQLEAMEVLGSIARMIVRNCPENDRPSLFNDLSVEDQQTIMRSLAAKKILPTDAIATGGFLQHAPLEYVNVFVGKYPEHCFDGRIWDEAYFGLDYQDDAITSGSRRSVIERYRSLIDDVTWLARQDEGTLHDSRREQLIRAAMSLRLLQPDVEAAS
jgi:hypothetical protein